MSSPRRRAAAKTARAKPAPRAVAKPAAADPSADAQRLAAALERGLAQGRAGELAPEALQDLLAALCKTYSAQLEDGRDYLPLSSRTALNGTEVMATASGLLKAANLAVFELGMWQSWTGR